MGCRVGMCGEQRNSLGLMNASAVLTGGRVNGTNELLVFSFYFVVLY